MSKEEKNSKKSNKKSEDEFCKKLARILLMQIEEGEKENDQNDLPIEDPFIANEILPPSLLGSMVKLPYLPLKFIVC